jgi:hypothetical protein
MVLIFPLKNLLGRAKPFDKNRSEVNLSVKKKLEIYFLLEFKFGRDIKNFLTEIIT